MTGIPCLARIISLDAGCAPARIDPSWPVLGMAQEVSTSCQLPQTSYIMQAWSVDAT